MEVKDLFRRFKIASSDISKHSSYSEAKVTGDFSNARRLKGKVPLVHKEALLKAIDEKRQQEYNALESKYSEDYINDVINKNFG